MICTPLLTGHNADRCTPHTHAEFTSIHDSILSSKVRLRLLSLTWWVDDTT